MLRSAAFFSQGGTEAQAPTLAGLCAGAEKPLPTQTPHTMVAQLTYWSGQGNAEVIRLMMAACGEEWEDRVALTDPPETHMR